MWCVGRLTAEYRRRMYELLDLYARPYRADQPVICIDEKSKQLLRHSRPPLPLAPGKPARVDYEYVRAGTCNIFVAVEPQGGQRVTQVLRRVVFHYTPKHASWLNMAEIEIAALGQQCLNRRIGDRSTIEHEVTAWQQRRNAEHRIIEWTFTRQRADQKLGRHYVS